MLSAPELAAILDEITYRPGWRLTLADGGYEGPVMVVDARVPDADNPGEATDLHIVSHVPPMIDEARFVEWVDWRLRRVALHEHAEFLRFRGCPHADPGHGAQEICRPAPFMEFSADADRAVIAWAATHAYSEPLSAPVRPSGSRAAS